ncbi:MAG: hypothetical protein JRN11_04480 [Nitrososphaerota archaeon]|nr:hypothetical protein [Nitrososphaerota archaeon]MDG7025982.1 hypothetical protein [Nitrososphaerota archaeon]
MRIPRLKSRRKGVAGIIAAVLMFTMLFTVGAGYFLYVNQANTVYTKALLARAGGISSQAEEALSLATGITPGGHISVYANDTGGIGINITSLYVLGPSGATLVCMGVGLPSGCANGAPFPVWVNVGGGSGLIDTGYAPVSGDVYTIKVVTQRGSVFSATYPTAATSLAARALSSGAIGDLYLEFGSYYYYDLTQSGCDSSSGWCMSNAVGTSAFAIPSSIATASPIAFSVVVTDLNPNQLNITLDQFSVLEQLMIHGVTLQPTTWYISSNTSTGIDAYYKPVVLVYDQPTFLLFAATANPVCIEGQSSPTCSTFTASALTCQAGNKGACPGVTAPVFLVSHGCLGMELSKCTYATANYGQNSPYVTTLYT